MLNESGRTITQSVLSINGGDPVVFVWSGGISDGSQRRIFEAGLLLPATFDAIHVLSDGSMVETHDTVQAEDPVVVVR